MTRRWIVTALGKDRPGIVAGVTKILYGLGCNLEDSAMTRLEGEFTIMLIFETPARLGEGLLRRALVSLERNLRMAVHLKPLTRAETGTPRKRGRRYRISVYGADRPGIVFHVSKALARANINITDAHTHRSGRGRPLLYLLLLEVEVPPRRDLPTLERQLRHIAKRLGVEVSLRPAEADVL